MDDAAITTEKRSSNQRSLPNQVLFVLSNQLYIEKEGLPPPLINRLIRLAAFQNPEFYKAQSMRFPTFGKPRIISCAEDFPKHIGLPRGCLDEALDLLNSLKIEIDLRDERDLGRPVELLFHGELKPEQKEAAESIQSHDMGVLAATTAIGKTVVAAHLIAKRKRNTMVLDHRRQLLDQWMAQLTNFLDLAPSQIAKSVEENEIRRESSMLL